MKRNHNVPASTDNANVKLKPERTGRHPQQQNA